jgi:hypothetical protein
VDELQLEQVVRRRRDQCGDLERRTAPPGRM